MGTLLKWGIGGGIIGLIVGIFSGEIVIGCIAGGIFAVVIRKWLFRTFWQ